ncbi:MAG: hypothetical protein LC744_04275, partial [Chloroflexi bacterium]|nr:hypothetical protein [Chloroflexota bacterium]
MPELTELRREHIEAFPVDLGQRGQRPATLANRHRSLQQFYKWLLEKGEIKVSPMAHMRPAHVPEEPPEILRDENLQALLATCSGTDLERERVAWEALCKRATNYRSADRSSTARNVVYVSILGCRSGHAGHAVIAALRRKWAGFPDFLRPHLPLQNRHLPPADGLPPPWT